MPEAPAKAHEEGTLAGAQMEEPASGAVVADNPVAQARAQVVSYITDYRVLVTALLLTTAGQSLLGAADY